MKVRTVQLLEDRMPLFFVGHSRFDHGMGASPRSSLWGAIVLLFACVYASKDDNGTGESAEALRDFWEVLG
jgi:hypothetical protein